MELKKIITCQPRIEINKGTDIKRLIAFQTLLMSKEKKMELKKIITRLPKDSDVFT